jgi:hypothetical protein
MCKVMMMAGIKANKTRQAWEFLQASVKHMSKTDNDGLGYVASSNGELFGERWLKNTDAFKRREQFDNVDQRMISLLGDALSIKKTYNSFGNRNLGLHVNAIMLHTRMATCSVNIENTHPFVVNETALIHNGVINNVKDLKQYQSTCDSECIVNEYIDGDVISTPNAINDVVSKLKGYYAVGILSKTIDGVPYLDVFKCDRANLVVGYVKELDTYVFCTLADILKKTAKDAKMTVTNIHHVNPGYLIRINAITGQRMEIVDFDYTQSQRSYNFNTSWDKTDIDRMIARKHEDDSYIKVG